jgi:hypothetical protein
MGAAFHFFELFMLLLPVAVPSYSIQSSVSKEPQVRLTLDSSEAKQALVILHKEQVHQTVGDSDWQKLFATMPYQWLKARETGMGRKFTDEDFMEFMKLPETQARTTEWELTLIEMEQANMTALGKRVLAWLPTGAVIEARVFPLIKPRTNSFVWRNEQGEPAIFIYLEKQTQAQFETTVTHECHHIGLFSLEAQQRETFAVLPDTVQTTIRWMGAFGEGEAVLASADSTERRPHWEDDAIALARWDSDLMHFNQDLANLTQFFDEVLDGKLKGDAIREKASTFYGAQGPWYTVGYEMAVLVEKRFGRNIFTDCLLDPRLLLLRYNEVATEANKNVASLAIWPETLLRSTYADHPPPPLP